MPEFEETPLRAQIRDVDEVDRLVFKFRGSVEELGHREADSHSGDSGRDKEWIRSIFRRAQSIIRDLDTRGDDPSRFGASLPHLIYLIPERR